MDIYSEDRYDFNPGALYKHFVTLKCLGITIFHTFWLTGNMIGQTAPNDGGFHVRGKQDYIKSH